MRSVTKTIRIDSQPPEKPAHTFHTPMRNARVTSHFGERKKSYHTGVDFKGKRNGGDIVYASRKGRVTFAGRQKGYGKFLVIKHPDGMKSRYAHLKKINVKKGDKVALLQRIGLVGSTGRTTGPHLHFEILTATGRFVDPLYYLR